MQPVACGQSRALPACCRCVVTRRSAGSYRPRRREPAATSGGSITIPDTGGARAWLACTTYYCNRMDARA